MHVSGEKKRERQRKKKIIKQKMERKLDGQI